MKQKQVTKGSGTAYDFNLDAISLGSLKQCAAILEDYGQKYSYSVLVRRALRVYGAMLAKPAVIDQELIEIQRASKGVL